MQRMPVLILFAFLLALSIAMSGCAGTPGTVVDNGVKRSATQVEQDAQQVVERQGLSDKARVIADAPDTVSRTYTSRNGVVHRIEAQVYAGPAEDVKVFKLSVSPAEYERVLPVLFGDDVDKVVERPIPTDPGFTEWVVPHGNDDFTKRMVWVAREHFSHFNFFNSAVQTQKTDWDDEDASAAVLVQTQQPILASFYRHIEALGLVGATVNRFRPTSMGCDIIFTPQYTRLPAIAEGPTVYGMMNLTEHDISSIHGNFMQEITWEENVPQILSFDQVMQIAGQHLTGDDYATRGAVFDRISLAHVYFTNQDEAIVARPVWWFAVVQQENRGVGGDYETGEGASEGFDDLGSFAIDAVTGLVQKVV